VQNQTATAEGGPNYVEYITKCGLKPGLTDPQDCSRYPGGKQLWDFAFAGSDISTAYTPLHHNFTVSLVNQTLQFKKYANPVLEEHVGIDKSRTLVDIWIGINDIGDSSKYDVDFPSFYNELITTLFEQVEIVYDLGYKNYLFMKLPPLNRTPPNLIRPAGPLPNATMIEWYNDALLNHSETFAAKHEDSKVMVFDTTTFLNYVLDHPTQYGIKNTTDYCAAYDQPYINTDPAKYGCQPLDEFLYVQMPIPRLFAMLTRREAGSTQDT
jgi:phospholipase/lecithinase/hemolysin